METDEACLADDVECPAFDHSFGTAQGLFARLEQEDITARELSAACAEGAGDAQERCHVDVVPAGVHGAVDVGVERYARVLPDGQPVDIGSQHDAAARRPPSNAKIWRSR